MAGQKPVRDPKTKKLRDESAVYGRMTANQKLVSECFKMASQKEIEELLELFADDVIIYEPFSKKEEEEGLHGKPAVRSFLNMVTLASDDSLRYDISIEEDSNDKIAALVMFEKGDKITAKFTFEMTPGKDKDKKIRVVRVEFLDDNHG
jgi:ketosteroid isomerase-like protein